MQTLRSAALLSAFTLLACGGDKQPASNRPPSLSSITTLSGAVEDTAVALTYQLLAAAADAADPDGDPISFRLEALASGTLTNGGAAVETGALLAAGGAWTWQAAQNANGVIEAFSLKAFDGTAASDAAVMVTIQVAPANDPPTLTSISSLTGAEEDLPFTITHATLLGASDAADIDGDDLAFRIEAVLLGTLTMGGSAVTPGTTLLTSTSDPLVFTPPSSTTGLLTPFQVVATDGELVTSPAVDVTVNVSSSLEKPTLTTVSTLTGAWTTEPYTISYAILSAAADEDDPQGDPIAFRVESIQNGTLEQTGAPVVTGVTMLSSTSDPLIWTYATAGTTDAFSIVAHDGNLASRDPVQVSIEVTVPPAFGAVWIGGTSIATDWRTDGLPAAGRSDGTLDLPADVLAAGSYLYVADVLNDRISRYDLNIGGFAGWIGGIDLPPNSGDPGCDSAAPGTFTPGWCEGGAARRGAGSGFLSRPSRLMLVGTTLYVSDSGNNAVNKYDVTDGSFLGAISGGMERPVGIAMDATHIYIVEDFGHRVSRWDHTGATETHDGWLGRVGPDAGDVPSACAGGSTPAVDTATNDWCTGGNSQSGNRDGELNRPTGLGYFEAIPGDGKLVVTDQFNYRILLFDASSGAFEGWLGAVANIGGTGGIAPLGGDCASQAVGYVAQGWCTGGLATQETGIMTGGLWSPRSSHVAGGKLYQTDGYSLLRYDALTGAFEAWMGGIGFAAPTSCINGVPDPFNGAPSGSWCVGGRSGGIGPQLGIFSNTGGVSVTGSDLFVVDAGNDRIQRFDVTTGTPEAWLGGLGVDVGGWSPNDLPGSTAGYGDGMLSNPNAVFVHTATDALYVTMSYRLMKFQASTGEFVGWTGRSETVPDSCTGALPAGPGPTSSWCKGGEPGSGWADGEFDFPAGLVVTDSYIYVGDVGDWRVVRFTLDGAFAGWIGTVGSIAPDSPAACTSTPTDSFTPDWCWGGSMRSDHLGQPYHLTISGSTLYLTNSSRHHLAKVNITDGAVAYQGWTGRVGPDAADVPADCDGGATPGVGEATGTWCRDGNSQGGSEDGMIYNPAGLAIDGSDNLYVAGSFYRISKYDSTGAFIGWIGGISTSPTGPAGPCVGATGVTPGWCTGGSPSSGWEGGYFNNLRGIYYDVADDVLFVSNFYNDRVDKVDGPTGSFLGWAGEVDNVPTGPDAECTSAVVGEITPGWCTGGYARESPNNGSLVPHNVFASPTHLYVLDRDYYRVTRLVKSPL